MNYKFNNTRRNFLKHSLCSAAGITAASSVGINLGMANSALAQSATKFDDYKALVCVFLLGGNDSFNMLVPTDNSEYQIYQGIRQSLAYPQDELLSLSDMNSQNYALGMPPAMAELHGLFGQKKLSILANTGPLLRPVTKIQAKQDRSALPPQLFSHNTQQNHWQTSVPQSRATSGWAGRMAELVIDSQARLPINMSIAGNNLFQRGPASIPFTINPSGAEQFWALDPAEQSNLPRLSAFQRLLSQKEHLLEQGFNDVLNRAAVNNGIASSALEQAYQSQVIYPEGNSLAEQLNMVARVASVQAELGQNRQIFFVGLGGWDTHDDQATQHPQLLSTLSKALAAFQANIDEIGLADNITTFTMSDFGRTLTSNGDGTDHGWGGHQLIMGGAVQGGEIFGRMPSLELDSNDDIGDGRMIPTTSVDEYAATLSRWFGLSEDELNAVFPNLNRFENPDLSFFKM